MSRSSIALLITLLLVAFQASGQTNPAPQPLPLLIDFGNAGFIPPYTNMAAWTTGSLSSSLAVAESSLPTGDVTGFNSTPLSGSTGGQYGHAVSGSGRLTILQSSNATNGSTQAALAINTTGLTNISISYELALTVANARDVGIALQYRVGTTGAFTTITGTAATYNATSSNVGDADGTADLDNYTVLLPAGAEGQAQVQLRWITWRGAQAGSSSGIGIDNIYIASTNGIPACAEPSTQPTNLSFVVTPTTVSGSFTAATPAVDEYLVIRSSATPLSAFPVDGVNYTIGQSLGGGTVTAITSSTSFSDAGLTAATTYYYFIFSMNNEACLGGPNYFNNTPLEDATTTSTLPACSTPSSPSNLSLTPANAFITGSFTAASGANRYFTVISTNPTLSAVPVNGTTYTAGQAFGGGTVIGYNSSTSFVASGLTANTLYYVFVFSANAECTGEPYYNTSALTGSTTTTNTATGIPAGYYNTATGLSCQPLKTALRNISSAAHNPLTYSGVWTAYQYTDLHRNDANTSDIIWDIYTDDPFGPETYTFTYITDQCGNYNGEGDCYNREHTTPASWFNDAAPMYTDVHQLMPTDGWVNNKRSNFPYGSVTTPTYTSTDNQSKLGSGNNYGYTGIVFEPNDAFKGDLARTSLYMATRYENEIISQNWAGNVEAAPAMLSATEQPDAALRKLQVYENWYLKTMFDWMTQDPVSQKEIDRNNAIYYQSGQQNRNPFVDHPEYAAAIWQCTGVIPVTLIDFKATKHASTIILQWYATFETSFRQFEVERSINGTAYSKIGEVVGRNLANYSFTDIAVPNSAVVYYRLKLVDADGQYKYSNIIPVRLNNNFSNAIAYPNPAKDLLNIRLTENFQSAGMLVITDLSGRTLKQQKIAAGSINISLTVNNFAAGRYLVKIFNNSQYFNESFVILK